MGKGRGTEDESKHTLGVDKRTKQSHHWRKAYEKGPAQRNLNLEQRNDYEEASAKKDRAKRRKRAKRRHLRHNIQCEEWRGSAQLWEDAAVRAGQAVDSHISTTQHVL